MSTEPDALPLGITVPLTRRERLTTGRAGELYRSGQSACQIAEAYGITRQGAESRIRAAGLGGLQWCPIHGTHEELRQA